MPIKTGDAFHTRLNGLNDFGAEDEKNSVNKISIVPYNLYAPPTGGRFDYYFYYSSDRKRGRGQCGDRAWKTIIF